MKHLKLLNLLPLLIAAAFVMPRAHAAPAEAPAGTTSSYAALWLGLGMLLLGSSQRRNEPFKQLDE